MDKKLEEIGALIQKAYNECKGSIERYNLEHKIKELFDSLRKKDKE